MTTVIKNVMTHVGTRYSSRGLGLPYTMPEYIHSWALVACMRRSLSLDTLAKT